MGQPAQDRSPQFWDGEHSEPIDPVETSVPFSSRGVDGNRHFGFFPFFAKKPWPVVQAYIRHYTAAGDLVCDPFSGSGVTPVEALVLRRRVVASDINPVAQFITQMTAVALVDLDALTSAFQTVRARAKLPIEALDDMSAAELGSVLQGLDYPRTQIPASVRRADIVSIDQLHTPKQLAGLAILREAIEAIDEDLARDLLRLALANTARYANRTYILPSDKGVRRSPNRGDAGFLRRFSFSPAPPGSFYEHPVWPRFEQCFKSLVDGKRETNRLIGDFYGPDNFTLVGIEAARIHTITGENVVDYCFTDPPYSNDINFLDLSVLWAAWLRLEITNETRRVELIEGGTYRKSRQRFEQEFASAMESIARALKPDHWFTLVYKHRDVSLWQTIVAACEESGLQYVNMVRQYSPIRSTRQVESPGVNPRGDMYLNFRKMPRQRYESLYGVASLIDIPTRHNYVEHEIERIVVSYLGADIELITSSIIQQVLDSRAFRNYRDNPKHVTEDIRKVLASERFATWSPQLGLVSWVMARGVALDASLDPADRTRYMLFDLLRDRTSATESDIRDFLFSKLAQEPSVPLVSDIARQLRAIAREISPHEWALDQDKVVSYKQLRLLFRPSKADALRERVEQRHVRDGVGLVPDLEGITLLLERLRSANGSNPDFASQSDNLVEALRTIFAGLQRRFADRVHAVLAVGDWARYGIDLRNVAYFGELTLEVVLRADDRPFDLYWRLGEEVFAPAARGELAIQFTLTALSEWRDAMRASGGASTDDERSIRLLAPE